MIQYKIKCPCYGSDACLEHYDENTCFNCGSDWDESERQPVSGWISCSERLPELGINVLVYGLGKCIKPFISIAFSTSKFWVSDDRRIDYIACNADNTYWHPLPEPPVEKDLES